MMTESTLLVLLDWRPVCVISVLSRETLPDLYARRGIPASGNESKKAGRYSLSRIYSVGEVEIHAETQRREGAMWMKPGSIRLTE
jgi:hypothetical protein